MNLVNPKIKVSQIGIVVRDLDRAMERYVRTAGIGPWHVFTNAAPPLRCIYRGSPAHYTVEVAMAQAGDVQLELIHYIDGDTIHREFLASRGEGAEHIGMFVPDLEKAILPYTKIGIGILQQVEGLGLSGDGRYAYLDTEGMLGTVLELIQPSTQPKPPDRVYPSTD